MRFIGPLRPDAADTTEKLMIEATVRALYTGVLFGLVMGLMNGLAEGIVDGVLFAVFMGTFIAGSLIYKRRQAQRSD